MVRAYLDLSQSHPQWVTSVAGYVATTDEWDRVIPEWQKRLDQWRLEEFHYVHIQNKTGGRWQECVNDFCWALRKSKVDHIGAALFDADWDRADWGRDTTKKLPTKYEQCLDLALRCLVDHCTERHPGEGVDVCCDADAPPRVIQSVFNDLQADLPSLQSIRVGNTRQDLPLQCADLSTGLLRKGWIAVDADTAARTPWKGIPFGGKGCHTVWSLRQGTLLAKTMARLGVPRSP